MQQRILMIEDTVELGGIISDILSMEGFEVVWKTNPLDALAWLERESPDLLMTDLVMSDLNGWQVIQKVRTELHLDTLPIIVLSAKGAPEDEQRTREVGGTLHLKKPCDSATLIHSVCALIRDEKNVSGFPASEMPDGGRKVA